MKARTVAVLGGGSWGTALADVLARNGHQTCIWARDPATADEIRGQSTNRKYLPGTQLAESLDCTTDLSQTLEGAEYALLACPSHAVREVLGLAEPHLAEPIVISAAKGIEIGTDLRMSEVIAEVLGQETLDRVAVFSGPSFADEILRAHRTLQQNAFGAFLATVKAWAGLSPNQCDARNEFTVEQSRKIVELLGKYNLKVPFI